MTEDKTPPSKMTRVPTVLIPVVRKLSKLHRQGHTIALLQALEELVSQFDSNIDIDNSGKLEEKLEKLESHLGNKLETITKKLEQMERAITSGRYNSNNTRPRRQVYSHQQPQVELQPRNNESLAQRLAVSPQSLIAEREKLTPKEFISWSRNRDPMSTGWEFSQKDKLYHPVK
ncbi:hypothetical protein HCG51_34190 (plasmid) [Tolypothrix sp. PCC 7910]|uniref:hypothetical protein n=1 Tax=Tolypothrix sp. PCC 7910 TaxID=2099387 RepID=UPI0014279523|nr:hypothetical protein [Tolypothrix sp. PCC 7910]QIR41739.1 hypothetical protein HCG51_34190 [Tolypothrix sp. PCC 7910]